MISLFATDRYEVEKVYVRNVLKGKIKSQLLLTFHYREFSLSPFRSNQGSETITAYIPSLSLLPDVRKKKEKFIVSSFSPFFASCRCLSSLFDWEKKSETDYTGAHVLQKIKNGWDVNFFAYVAILLFGLDQYFVHSFSQIEVKRIKRQRCLRLATNT